MNYKVLFPLIIFSVIYLGFASFPHAEVKCRSIFHDIDDNSELCYYTNYLYYQRVVSGYGDGTYRPGNTVTRAELSKYIKSAFDITVEKEDQENVSEFKDIPKTYEFSPYIYALRATNLISGYSDNTYRPDEPVEKGMLMKFVIAAAKSKKQDLFNFDYNYSFQDVSENDQFYEFINMAYLATSEKEGRDQIVSLDEKGQFNPKKLITREEMAKIISNAMLYGEFNSRSKLPFLSTVDYGIDSDGYNSERGFEIYQYDKFGMTILATSKPIEFTYIPKESPTVLENLSNFEWKYVVNGSFFGGKNIDAEHAGFLNVYGNHITTVSDEPQLTHVVRYHADYGSIEYYDRRNFIADSVDPNILEFQTGPMVVQDGEVTDWFVIPSKNGMGKHVRTLMATTDQTQKYFIIMRTPISLHEMGNVLTNLTLFKGRNFTAVNLDGGSSTAFASSRYEEYNFRSGSRLPILIGMK